MQRPPHMMPAQAQHRMYATPQHPQQRPPTMAQPPGRMMPQHPQMQQHPHPQYAHQMAQHQQRGHPAQRPQQHVQQVGNGRMAEEQELRSLQVMKHRSERPTDLKLPNSVEDVVVDPELVKQYNRLTGFEKKLDALMTRKDIEYQDRLKQRNRRTKNLRIWITNTAENQPWQGGDLDPNSFDFKSDSIATYRVKITGRLHEDDDDLNIDNEEGVEDDEERIRLQPARTKLSHFFKQITVEFDRSKDLQPDGATAVQWNKPAGFQSIDRLESDQALSKAANFDTLEFERKSDENINVTIHFYRDMTFGAGNESDEVCSLSPDLAWIVGSDEATRGEVIEAIYDYVRAEGLQHDDEKRTFHCDERLRRVFKNQQTVSFPALPNLINAPQFDHVQDLKPISLKYTIRVDPEYQNDPQPTIYDVIVPAEDLLHERLLAIRQLNPDWVPNLTMIKELDRQQALCIQKLKELKAKHTFYRNLEKDPVNFIRKWYSSQQRDLSTIVGDSVSETSWYVENLRPQDSNSEWTVRRNYHLPGDEWRRGGEDSVWGSQGVRESVALMVNKGKNIKAQ